jgi:hypothetical protein
MNRIDDNEFDMPEPFKLRETVGLLLIVPLVVVAMLGASAVWCFAQLLSSDR